jgi:hypothetical protein
MPFLSLDFLMLRVSMTLVLALLVGVALGNIQTRWSVSRQEEALYVAEHAGATHRIAEDMPKFRGIPKIELPEGTSFNFGQMQHGSEMSHAFPVRNVGDGPLSLEQTGSTCKCTVGELESSTLMPGQETKITLTWRAQTAADQFGQSATFRTNDPAQIELQLQIEGSVIDSFVFEPSQLSLGDFYSDLGVKKDFKVHCYTDADVQIERMEWSHEASKDLVGLEMVPISPELSERHSSATRAYQVTLTAAPGLAIGPFSSKISFITNYGDEIELPVLDVNGRVISDITVIGGSHFKPDRNVLDIGTVSSKEGFSTSIWLYLRDDSRAAEQQEVNFEVSVEQLDAIDSLRVTVGEPKMVRERMMVPVQFEVPIGAPEVYYPGTSKATYARVNLKTNSEKLPELPVYVKMMVKN